MEQPQDRVTVRVHLRDTQTGDEAWHVYEMDRERADDPDDPEGFWWTDGNWGCDCERGQLLAEALGREDPRLPCVGKRITVIAAAVDGVTRDWIDK